MALTLYRPLFWIVLVLLALALLWLAFRRRLRWWPAWILRLALLALATAERLVLFDPAALLLDNPNLPTAFHPAVRGIVVVAGRQGEDYSRSSIRGNHMNLGVPSAAGFPNGLWSVFFKAPVPSG